MRTLKLLLTIFPLVLPCSPLFAQEAPSPLPTAPLMMTVGPEALPIPTALPTPQATPTPDSPWAADINLLDYSLAETSYQLDPSRSNRNRMLQAAERLINLYCIKGPSQHYRDSYKEAGSACNAFTQKILTIDPSNPPATCARMGIDSGDCASAYSGVRLEVLRAGTDENSAKDLAVALEAKKSTSDVALTQVHLNSYIREYNLNKKKETKDKIFTIFYEQIVKYCSVTRYDVSLPNVVSTPTPSRPAPTSKPFEETLLELNKKRVDQNPAAAAPLSRKILVSDPCLSYLNLLKSFDPQHYLYICYAEGLYSPRCLRSQRVYKSQTSKVSGGPLSGDGISSF